MNLADNVVYRRWLAGLAMQAILQQPGNHNPEIVAIDAYDMADYMLAQGLTPKTISEVDE